MRTKVLGIALLTIAALLPADPAVAISVTRVVDGDTVVMSDGNYVRMLQIDTPEIKGNECYSAEATSALKKLLAQKGEVRLKVDVALDKTDRYGRQLRYLFIGKTNINLKMVQIGAAAPYFYRSERGMYAPKLLKAAEDAKAKQLGLWKACPGTQLTPTRALTTLRSAATSGSSASGECDPNYEGCIPKYPPDLNCADLKALGLTPVRLKPGGKDVHKLDRDGDGIACES